jgi:hypothetical protein
MTAQKETVEHGGLLSQGVLIELVFPGHENFSGNSPSENSSIDGPSAVNQVFSTGKLPGEHSGEPG